MVRVVSVWCLALHAHAVAFAPPSSFSGEVRYRQPSAKRMLSTGKAEVEKGLDADTLLMGEVFFENMKQQQEDLKQVNDEEKSLDVDMLMMGDPFVESLRKQKQHSEEEFTPGKEVALGSVEATSTSTSYGFVRRSDWQKDRPKAADDPIPFYTPPPNFVGLLTQQFGRNFKTMFGNYEEDHKGDIIDDEQMALQVKLASLTLSPKVVWDLEEVAGVLGVMKEPLVVRAPYHLLCPLLDLAFAREGSFVPERFYIMEKIGRTPYLTFTSMLNLYETFELWRPSEDVRVAHVAQELTKLRRMEMMEDLGGDQPWYCRFVAEHASLLTHATIVHLWLLSPSLAYRFALMLESHAFHTYTQFLSDNDKVLRSLPSPLAASAEESFDGTTIEQQDTSSHSLYDSFEMLRNDNANHALRLKEAYWPSVALHAPDTEKKLFFGMFIALLIGNFAPNSLGDGTFASLIDKIPGWP